MVQTNLLVAKNYSSGLLNPSFTRMYVVELSFTSWWYMVNVLCTGV